VSTTHQSLCFLAIALATIAPSPPERTYNPAEPLSAQQMNAVGSSDQYDTPPKFIRGRAPFTRALPLSERERRPSAVVIEFTIGLDGKARDFRVVSSAGPPCAGLAIDAMKQWQFEPARKKGKPVAVIMRAPFVIRPRES
jgi:TonB family protein